ncbi:hypothetical protein EI42_06353 [Thermosporothrix hazakensis]|jgi:hypothetical protein|uniref:Uncharacterized protein n=1 Tax=Thermosporothrix hazakensis TaxID=644383 RepID=A0A326TZQ3_THEHA|nr:hypothetical protein [Thermosporothrix hazakensis]PZW18082.1 hypothetical protein EI42_06353 [Thermosporothrix hazakensis]GCE50680.1 hypothetical protein KTH_55490 [Thermosporothrix hazakensis]
MKLDHVINQINWHPATHEEVHVPIETQRDLLFSWGIDIYSMTVTILGYPSRWKDISPVIKAARGLTNIQFVFGGPWWDSKLKHEGYLPPNVKTISHELNEVE